MKKNEITARIAQIKRFAVHDGDGIRTTVFFKGCPLRCVWCHNPECLSFEPQTAFEPSRCVNCGACGREDFTPEVCAGGARVFYGTEFTVEALLPGLLEDRDFYDSTGGGVTLSGGECLSQGAFCAALLKRLKEEGIHTAVDTCGFVPRETLDAVMPFTDLFLYDVKAVTETTHLLCTGQSNRRILENLRYLDSCGKEIEVRIPLVPGWNDGEMAAIADFLRPLKNVRRVKVLPYHNFAGSKYESFGMKNTLPERLPTEEELRAARAVFAPWQS